MRPILMKGHERSLTFPGYSHDGDLHFSCAKDVTPNVWFADNGDRLGTCRGRNGADVQTGQQLFTFRFDAPARSVEFSIGDGLAVITTDNFMDNVATAQVKHIVEDPDDQLESLLVITGIKGRINRAVWEPLNRTIVTADFARRNWWC
ncbi:hypothetical protein GUJ93_ZPchr0002g24549 [Zizania palustris]|uniref:Uncharacterized protein n=1 Tax=Zizania palustris TaxID=103762 RepID=A0A8J5V4J2_ZIZPA|nr:hypothetical protein GUJ93_ZPchr0002g24549 [Zizania palustris]